MATVTPRTQRERRAATRAAIVSAARTLYATRGFTETRIDDIAAAAGVAKGGVFHHFADKRAIFDAVTTEVADEVLAVVEQAADAAPDPASAIVAGSIAFVDACLDAGVRQIFLVDAPAVLGWQRWRQIDASRSMRSLELGIAALVADRGLDLNVAATTHFLSGAINELVFWLASSNDVATRRQVAAGLIHHVVQGLAS
jgi:AcrR family transcriptional regulator